MKGKRFATIDEIKSELKKEMMAIPKSAFQKCFEDRALAQVYYKYIRGDYFEGDKIDIDE